MEFGMVSHEHAIKQLNEQLAELRRQTDADLAQMAALAQALETPPWVPALIVGCLLVGGILQTIGKIIS
jgi:hypothetical protein